MKTPISIPKCIICKKGLAVRNSLDVKACKQCLDSATRHGLEALGYSAGVYLSLTGIWSPRDVVKAGFNLSEFPEESGKENKAAGGTPFGRLRKRKKRQQATTLSTNTGRSSTVITTKHHRHSGPLPAIPEALAYAASLPPIFDKKQCRKPIMARMPAEQLD